MLNDQSIANGRLRQDRLYEELAATYAAALQRLARAYEADPDRRRDLVQDIHLALWQSCARFDERCSLRTWVYRVAHNTATSHVIRGRRINERLFVGLESLDAVATTVPMEVAVDQRNALERLIGMVRQLRPPDRQVMLCYLEGLDANATGEITGLSASNVATKIHRIKNILARQFQEGGRYE